MYFAEIAFLSCVCFRNYKNVKPWMKHLKIMLLFASAFFFSFKGNVIRPYFAFCAVINGICYKTGLGKNKKESKSNAAKLALAELLNLENTGAKTFEDSGKYCATPN